MCETSTGEGDKKLNVSSAVIALKTAPDEATLYSKTKVVSQLFEFGTTEVAFIKVGTGGEVSHQSYLSEFRDASLVQFPRETMVMLDNAKRQKLNALLTEAKSNFALDVRGFMEEPRSYKITELTTDTLVTQTTEGEISNCVHTATSNLYNDFGLITKQQGY